MNYIELVADKICARVSPENLPDENTRLLFRIYAILLFAKGEHVEPADIHNAWVAWMSSIDPAHPALVPFGDLSHEAKSADLPYVDAVRQVAREVSAGVFEV